MSEPIYVIVSCNADRCGASLILFQKSIFHMVFHQHNDFCSYYVEEQECLHMCYFLQKEKDGLLPQKQLMALTKILKMVPCSSSCEPRDLF